MPFIRQCLIVVFALITIGLPAQIPKHIFNEITEETFSPKEFTILSKPIKERVGVYHFGESESEWDFVVIQNGDSVIIQLWNGEWKEKSGPQNLMWLRKCQTFNDVKIEGNKFFFGQYSGIFADTKEEKKNVKAVLLFCDPIGGRNYGKDSAEAGFFSRSIATYFSEKDRYNLSLTVQPDSYFAGKAKQELKILRNTIYANYGLLFQPGGEMDKYFRQKDWYEPFQKDVSRCLTSIEKRNLQTILKFEQL